MIGKIVGAAVGREIDRRHGTTGLKAALIGVAAAGAMRRMGPLGIVLGGAWLAKQAHDRRRGRADAG